MAREMDADAHTILAVLVHFDGAAILVADIVRLLSHVFLPGELPFVAE
jgi:hypothetical protein